MGSSDSLKCFAHHFPYGYRMGYHYSTTFRGMFMDTARSPELLHMAFTACHRHDTGEAAFLWESVKCSMAFAAYNLLGSPIYGLTVLVCVLL